VKFPPDQWIKLTAEQIDQSSCKEPGPKRFLVDLLDFIQAEGCQIMTMEGLYHEFGK
jgi:hypothetical protein